MGINLLSAENISKRFGERLIFETINVGVNQGDKVALVGINGSGKSTLLRILAGLDDPDTGGVSVRKGCKLAFLNQEPDLGNNDHIMDAIFSADNPVAEVVRDYEWALLKSQQGEDNQDEFQKLLERMDDLSAWDYESRAKQILGKLGLHDIEKKVSELSGGQKKRVALARALIDGPDLLIMDEPTNHLDLESIEWLENYLSESNLTLLMVTHDRYFLDKVCNHIVELEDGEIHKYQGDYAYYLEKKTERQEQINTVVDKAKNLMKTELDWIRRMPKARGTKSKSRIDAFEDLKVKASLRTQETALQLESKMSRQGGKILEMKNVGKHFDGNYLFKGFSYVFKKGEKVGIIGKNGTGKTTFINLIMENLEPDHGRVIKGFTTVFGNYTQEELEFKQNQKMIDKVKEMAEVVELKSGSKVSISQFMTLFRFPPKRQQQYIRLLSGGEKRRLQLMLVLMTNPNFLILDEPTNDLDLVTLNVLEDFLINFQGCLLLVSHDRYFMDRLVDHLFVFEGNNEIIDFPGNYSQYRLNQMERKRAEKKIEKEKSVKVKDNNTQSKKLSFKEKQELDHIEKTMPKLEAEKKAVIEKLNGGSQDHQELQEWSEEIKKLNDTLSEMEDRWLELSM